MNRSIVLVVIVAVSGGALASTQEPATLTALLAQAREAHPGLRAATLEAEAARHEAREARARPNPRLEAEAENIGGDASGADEAEFTLLLTQPLPLGRKRAWSGRAADAEVQRAELARALTERQLRADLGRRFYEALALRATAELRAMARTRAETFLDLARRRVDAGDGTALEVNRATTEIARQRLDAANAERAYRDLLADIATVAGWPEALTDVQGDLADIPPLPGVDRITASLKRLGPYRDAELRARRDEAAAKGERANRVPDAELSLGLRRNRAEDVSAYVAGIGFELPLWNRNTASVRAADARAAAARAARDQAAKDLEIDARRLWRELSASRREAKMYRDELLPALRKNAAQAEQSYRQGWVGYLELLDAQDALGAAAESRVNALLAYWQTYLETYLELEN